MSSERRGEGQGNCLYLRRTDRLTWYSVGFSRSNRKDNEGQQSNMSTIKPLKNPITRSLLISKYFLVGTRPAVRGSKFCSDNQRHFWKPSCLKQIQLKNSETASWETAEPWVSSCYWRRFWWCWLQWLRHGPWHREIYPDFAPIGRAPTLLCSYWSRAPKWCYAIIIDSVLESHP